MDSSTKISVIIPNRDGAAYLQVCLDAIAAQTVTPHETILVDDCSKDNSLELVREKYPWVKVIMSTDNGEPQGFSGGVNAGIKAATGDMIALLNNDTEADPKWLEEMATVMDKNPQVASCACKMYLKDGKHINALGLMLDGRGSCRTIADGKMDCEDFSGECEIFGPSGGAALWRKSVLDEIGIFEHDYFAYYEDADLAFRARAAGYKAVYAPKSKIIHLEGRCPSLKRFDKVAFRLRNCFWFVWTNFTKEMLAENFGGILWETYFRHLFKYGPRIWKVEGRSFWKASLWILLSLPKIFSMRAFRKSKQEVESKELQKWVGCNPFAENAKGDSA